MLNQNIVNMLFSCLHLIEDFVCVCAFSIAVITDLDLFRMAQLYSGFHGFK